MGELINTAAGEELLSLHPILGGGGKEGDLLFRADEKELSESPRSAIARAVYTST